MIRASRSSLGKLESASMSFVMFGCQVISTNMEFDFGSQTIFGLHSAASINQRTRSASLCHEGTWKT